MRESECLSLPAKSDVGVCLVSGGREIVAGSAKDEITGLSCLQCYLTLPQRDCPKNTASSTIIYYNVVIADIIRNYSCDSCDH